MKFVVLLFAAAFHSNLLGAQTCPSEQHWVRAHHRRAYTKADGTFVSATEVTAHCQGNPSGYQYWQSKLKNGRPDHWSYKKEITKSWTDEERERTLEALGELPEILAKWPVNIYRMKDSLSSIGNDASSTDGIMVLYDEAFDQSHTLAEVLAHELAHENFRHLGEGGIKDYADATGWRKPWGRKDEDWKPTRFKYVEPDGIQSIDEDYANNVQYFLFHPTKLRFFTPEAYYWIHRHFGDKFNVRGRK